MKKFKKLVLGLFTLLFAFSSASCNLSGMLGGISLSGTESEANSDTTSDVTSEPMGSVTIDSNTSSEDTPSANTYIDKLYSSYDELLEFYNKALRDSADDEKRLERLENLEIQIDSILYQINMYAENGKLSYSEYRSLLKSINSLEEDIDYILNFEGPVFLYTIHLYDEYGINYDKWTSSEGEVFELPYLERENHEAYWYDIEYGNIYYNYSTIVLDRDYHLQERYVPSDDYEYNTLEGIADLPDGTWVENIEVVVNVNYKNQHFVSDRFGNEMMIYGKLEEFYEGETYVVSGEKATYHGYPEIINPVINEVHGYQLTTEIKEIYWWNVNEEWVKENNYQYFVIREAEVISYTKGGNSIIKIGDVEITFYSESINEDIYLGEIIDLYCVMNGYDDGLFAKANNIYRHNPINESCEIFVDANGDYYYESTYSLNYGDIIYLYPVFDYANQSFTSWEIIEYDQFGNQTYSYNYDYELKYIPCCVRVEIRVNYVDVDASTVSIDTNGDGYFDSSFSGYKGEIIQISADYDPVQYYFVGWEITTTDQYGNTNKYIYSYDSYLTYSFEEKINAEIVAILGGNDIYDDFSTVIDVTFNYDSWQEGVTVWTDFAIDGTIAPDPLGISEKDLSGCHTTPIAEGPLDLGSYYFAIDANGYIVYASYGLGLGYGSPTDGYYHNQNSKDPGSAEYWALHDEWDTWPNKTSDGRNAWTLYDFIIPEGGFVIKGYAKDPEFVQIWTLLTGQAAVPVATNVTLEGHFIPGELNNWYFSIDKNHQLKIRERLESEIDNGFGEQEKETPAVDFVPTIDDEVKTYNTLEDVAYLEDDTIIENIKVVVVWLRGANAIVHDVQGNTILIYDQFLKEVAVGDTLVLGSAKKTTYNGYPELMSLADVQVLATYGKLEEVAPIELTADNVAEYWVEANNYRFFKLIGAVVVGEKQIQLGNTVIDLYSTTFPEDVAIGDTIDITLTMQCYKGVVQGKGNPEDIYRYYNIEIDANGDEIVDYYETYPYGFEKQLYAENFDSDFIFKHWVKITTNEYGEEIYQEISTEHNPFILIEEDAKYVAVYDYAAWTNLPVNYYEVLNHDVKGLNIDCGGDALSVITDGIIHVDGQWSNTTYGGSANWRFIAVIDNDGKIAYAVNNPANGYGGPSGSGYYAHPDYASDYTTNPALNILEGYGPWTPEDSSASTKFEIVVPEGGFILVSHGVATQTLVGSLASDTFADDYSDSNINRRESLDENARVYYDALNNYIRVFRCENLDGYQYQAVLNNVSDDYLSVYDSNVENVLLGDFTVAIDVNGKIIFAGKTVYGYGGPADGFYHDGNYYWVPGEHNGIFVLDPEFAPWPATTLDGQNAWTLYTVKAPEGGYIITGKEYQMYDLLFNIDNKFSLSGNYYEGLADGLFNDTHAIAMACGINMAAFDLHIKENATSSSMWYTGSVYGDFIYNYDTGLFETSVVLNAWNSIYFTYVDDNGIEQQLTYNNTSFVGNITSDPSIFGAYSEGAGVLFIEEGWAENGQFMSSETVTLDITFDPITYTLTVLKDGEEIVEPDIPEVEEPEEDKPLRYEYIALEEGICVETDGTGWNPLNYNIVVDGNGKIIYASYGSMGYSGYGGPGDGFYHDGTYQAVPGQVCGAFELYSDWAVWPNTTTSGMNAWERYNPYIPENGFAIMSNDENAMLKIVNQLFDLNYATLPTSNHLFESELVDGAYNHVVVSYYYPTSKPSVTYEGTYMDTFEYNEETGLYETTISLKTWNHVIFKYYDENGNSIPLTYKTANLEGNFTSEDFEGADWTSNLFHEKDEEGIDWAEYGKFMVCMDASYYVTFDPNTMTLNVSVQ